MQTQIDTIGNNVANADSDGYQEADVQFSDILTQQLAPGSGSSTDLASTDPSSIGAGSQVSAMQTNFNQGAIVQTGVPTDAAIQGNGFFVVDQGGNTYYTRAGNFQLDVNGTLSTASGGIVQGWAGTTSTTGPTGAITIPSSMTIAPQETANITMGGNIPSGGAAFTTTATVYDAQGNEVPLTMTYTPTATANQWTMQASVNGSNLFSSGVTLTFDSKWPTGELLGRRRRGDGRDDQGRDYCDHPGAPDRLQLEREGDRFRLPGAQLAAMPLLSTRPTRQSVSAPRTATPREACSPGRSARAGSSRGPSPTGSPSSSARSPSPTSRTRAGSRTWATSSTRQRPPRASPRRARPARPDGELCSVGRSNSPMLTLPTS